MSEENQNQQFTQAQFEKLAQLQLLNLELYPYRVRERIVGKYKKEDLAKPLSAPELDASQKTLRYISRYAYNASQHYKRLIHYLSDFLMFRFYLEPYGFDAQSANEKKLNQSYAKIARISENMKVEHEFQKALRTVFKDGIYFGYIYMDDDSFFFQELDPDYCKISRIVDGTYAFAYDMNYFFVYPEQLAFFPQEFQIKFNDYITQKDGKINKWVPHWRELDYQNTICIKFDDSSVYYPIPPFVNLFGNILDIEDFKDLAKAKTEIDNYKIITMKIPMDTKNGEPNKILLTPDFVSNFFNNTKSQLPEQVGLTATAMDLGILDFERDNVDKNHVFNAQQLFWDNAGVSSLLFQANNTSIGLNNSIIVDEAMIFGLLRQFESWMNRFLKKYNDKKYKFRVKFLNMTHRNEKDIQSARLQEAQYGGSKLAWLASMGHSPSSALNMSYFENKILKLQDLLVPLQSSHTQSSTPNGQDKGRPQMDEKDLSDKGQEARDLMTNETRAK